MSKGLNRFSAETIAFQRDKVFTDKLDKLTQALIDEAELSDHLDRVKLAATFANPFQQLIKERTGLNINLVFVDNPNSIAYVMPMYFTNQHTLMHPYFKGKTLPSDIMRTIKKSIGGEGTIDLKNARVGGIFSEYKHALYINPMAMVKRFNMTAREMCAIILHEVGHCFTMYEYADRVDSQNQVIATTLEEFGKPNFKPETFKVTLKELAVAGVITKEEADEAASDNDRTIIGPKLFAAMMRSTGSQLPKMQYDKTASEQLADAFAARFGYYRELVTGLDKFSVITMDPAKSKAGYWAVVYYDLYVMFIRFYFLTMFVMYIGGFILGVAGISLGILNMLLFSSIVSVLILIWLVFATEGDDKRDMTYDDLWNRYARIKHQLIQELKVTGDKEALKGMLEALDNIDRLQSETRKTERVFTYIVNLLKPAARDAKANIELQKLVEDLSSNDLYVQSAKFSLLND